MSETNEQRRARVERMRDFAFAVGLLVELRKRDASNAYEQLVVVGKLLLEGYEVAIMDTARLASLIPTEWEHRHERELAAAVRVAIVNADYSALRAWGQS